MKIIFTLLGISFSLQVLATPALTEYIEQNPTLKKCPDQNTIREITCDDTHLIQKTKECLILERDYKISHDNKRTSRTLRQISIQIEILDNYHRMFCPYFPKTFNNFGEFEDHQLGPVASCPTTPMAFAKLNCENPIQLKVAWNCFNKFKNVNTEPQKRKMAITKSFAIADYYKNLCQLGNIEDQDTYLY